MTVSVLHHHRHPAPARQPISNGTREAAVIQDADILSELGRRLDAMWRYDRFVEHARGRPVLEAFWKDIRALELHCIDELEEFLKGIHGIHDARTFGRRITAFTEIQSGLS